MTDAKDKLVSLEDLKVYADTVNDETTGINLLRGTKDFNKGHTLYANSTDTLSGYIEGFKIAAEHKIANKDNDYSVLEFHNNGYGKYSVASVINQTIPKDDVVTISFEIKFDDLGSITNDGQIIYALYFDNSFQRLAGASFSLNSFKLPKESIEIGKWYKVIIHHTVLHDIGEQHDCFLELALTDLTNSYSSFSMRKLKAEIGNIKNPVWSPSPLDTNYINDETTGINLMRGTREWVYGTKAYGTSPYFTDGWQTSNYLSKEVDEEGFTVLTATAPSTSTALSYAISKAELKPNEQVTISFEFNIVNKTNYKNDSLIAYVAMTTPENTSIGNVNITVAALGYDVAQLEECTWYKGIYHFTVPANSTVNHHLRTGVVCVASSTVKYRKFKAERGYVNNPVWSAAPADIDYINDETTGVNLIRGTRDFYPGSNLLKTDKPLNANIYSDGFAQRSSGALGLPANLTFYTDEEGYTVAEFNNQSNTSSSLNTYASSFIEPKLNQTYTVSYEFQTSDESFNDVAVYVAGYSPESNSMVGVSTNGNYRPKKIGEWNKCNFQYTHTNDSYKYIFVRIRSNSDKNIKFRKLKLEEGAINNPVWSPSPFDTEYINETTGINLLRGTRDCIAGTKVFESTDSNAWISYTDGFKIGEHWNVYKDADEFSVLNCPKFVDNKSSNAYINSSHIFGNMKKGDLLTLSFEYMIEDKNTATNSTAIGYFNYFDSTGKQVKPRTLTVTNLFGHLDNIEEGVWKKIIYTYSLEYDIGADTFVQVLFNITNPEGGVGGFNGIHIKKIKLEQGSISNPIWSSSPFDIASIESGGTGSSNIPMNSWLFRSKTNYIQGAYRSNKGLPGWNASGEPAQYPLPLTIENGGTGATTARAANCNMFKDMYEESSVTSSMNNNDCIAYVTNAPNTANGAIRKVSFQNLWEWIASKIRSVFGFNSDNKLPADRIVQTYEDIDFKDYGCIPEQYVYFHTPNKNLIKPGEFFITKITVKYEDIDLPIHFVGLIAPTPSNDPYNEMIPIYVGNSRPDLGYITITNNSQKFNFYTYKNNVLCKPSGYTVDLKKKFSF